MPKTLKFPRWLRTLPSLRQRAMIHANGMLLSLRTEQDTRSHYDKCSYALVVTGTPLLPL